MRLLFTAIFFAILIQSCESNRPRYKHTEIKKLEWLLGAWENTSDAMQFTEIWQKKNDSTFTGNGYGIEKGDTIFKEKLELAERLGKVYYVATVNEHLAGKPTTFALVADSAKTWIFENPNHDFPQRIIYKQLSENALHARVEGTVNGKAQGEEFHMHRTDNP